MDAELSYRIDGSLLTVRLVGDYSLQAYETLLRRAFADPATPDVVLLLVDATASTVRRGSDDMKIVAAMFIQFAARIRRIAVVTGTDVHYGLIRMASALVEDAGLVSSPFRTRAEALRWLGLTDDLALDGAGGPPAP